MLDSTERPKTDTSVSLRDHLDALLEHNARYSQAILRENDARYLEMFRQIDLRYQQRYDAQIKAVEAAFLAQQTAMQAALLAAEKAVQTALQAAEKAVTKAEIAAEKRFDSVNEFRDAYKDIIALQMPRTECEQRLSQLFSKQTENLESINNLRTDQSTMRSRSSGFTAALGAGLTILTILIAVLTYVTRR